jgi:methylenetetrahydrofolate dehydrogenase (NADP+)/methenyltetrahydrofolate cyclohydrolase
MAKLLKGAEVTAALNERTKQAIESLSSKGITPTLGIIRVGERPDDVFYEKSVIKNGSALGLKVKQYILEETVTQEKLLETIKEINEDANVHGVLMFRPLPKHLKEDMACQALSPEKDVDGITDSSMAGVFAGKKLGFPPCTPQACMEILDYYGYDCTGKKAVVVGRSLVVGKPAAIMLIGKNATTTVCHTKTKDLSAVCREADILIAAAGRAGVVTKEYLSPSQVVIDVGINVNEDGKLCGDVAFEEAEPVVGAITPVPGGVGTVTTAVLIGHVVEAARRAL